MHSMIRNGNGSDHFLSVARLHSKLQAGCQEIRCGFLVYTITRSRRGRNPIEALTKRKGKKCNVRKTSEHTDTIFHARLLTDYQGLERKLPNDPCDTRKAVHTKRASLV